MAAIQIAPDRSTAFYNYIFPSSTNVWDIGASGFNWRNLYVNTIFLAGGANNQGLIQENTGNLLIGTGSTTGSGNATSITFGTAPAGVGTQTALTLNSDQSATFVKDVRVSTDNGASIGESSKRWTEIFVYNIGDVTNYVNNASINSLTLGNHAGSGLSVNGNSPAATHTTTQPCTGTQVFTLGILTSTTGTC